MKRLTSQLRNRDFDTFLKFVECILRAGSENPKINLSIVESIHHAVANFDERNGTSHASLIFHLKEQCVTESAAGESLEKVVDDESNEDDKRQTPDDLPDPPLELPLMGAPLGRFPVCLLTISLVYKCGVHVVKTCTVMSRRFEYLKWTWDLTRGLSCYKDLLI